MKLIVVESPTKAKTLSRFLGDGYAIEASMGHIRDLPKSKLGVDVENNFKPDYEMVKGKQKIATKLKQRAKGLSEIILATDPDREGEAIAYHVEKILNDKKKYKINRIVFHEITKNAIEAALKKPGKVDIKLFEAQQARRILDRLVGYSLSPILWRKVRRGLSAGRVQSVAVRLIVEKEAEIKAFKPEEYWEIEVKLSKDNQKLIVSLHKIDGKKALIDKTQKAKEIERDLEESEYKVSEVRVRISRRHPLPPFMTSTMQRVAGNRFGWSAKKTMREAQQLYEKGMITYHRTDSLNLASESVSKIRKLVETKWGKQYVPDSPNYYKSKSKSAQGAHEAIRPTSITREEVKVSQGANKLYRLIWERTVMSQMMPALIEKTTMVVTAKGKKGEYELKTEGDRLEFAGFLKANMKMYRSVGEVLTGIKEGDELGMVKVTSTQKFTQPPARFSEASLIKMLEEKGIGRPSTYAPIISTIQDRNYVEKKEQRLWPTVIGEAVTKFLKKYFKKIMDYEFTAGMEEGLDKIAVGEQKWEMLLKNFFSGFDKKLKDVQENAKRVKIGTEKTGKKCPTCKKADVVIRVGRFGKFLSCDSFPDCKYTATYKEIVEGIRCPDCKGEVVVKKSRKGKQFFGCGNYPKCKWASWKKPKA